jgi:hypothetical protein
MFLKGRESMAYFALFYAGIDDFVARHLLIRGTVP